ncbi:heme/hemin ABC transporter substrate-binding protein [Parafrankia sp. FMc2]|uniref:heme/hemin ABC transporter substrate-binding protein n=1 Tax=Parafrankia sp. FMc2 TaxID=3233196 RepID=UPI0034D4B4D5
MAVTWSDPDIEHGSRHQEEHPGRRVGNRPPEARRRRPGPPRARALSARLRVTVVLAVAAVTGLLLAGCGSSDEAEPSTAPSSTASTSAVPSAGPTEAAPVLPVTVPSAGGGDVTVTDVSRIIPLNGEIAEIVFALGLGDRVVATDVSATYPPEAAARPKIGYQRSLAAEGILALRPTILVGTPEAGPPPVIEQLRSAGVPTVIVERGAGSLDGIGAKIRAVGAALGVPGRGVALAATTQTELDRAVERASGATSSPKVAFLYVRGQQNVAMIGGEGSGADLLIEAAHGVDAGSAAGLGEFTPLTAEALVAADPDHLLLLSDGLESVGGIDGLLRLPGVAQTTAGENRAVIDLDDLELLGLGPRTPAALDELVDALHPGLR